ncbi:hypothetical protein OG350_16870 [Streptomyces achromogenes]|uniref:Uncharacterized protein n=1 Tax=Streptomyces achromogenes TaxID=67255 RepID=A0ABZ1KMT7_STRAH
MGQRFTVNGRRKPPPAHSTSAAADRSSLHVLPPTGVFEAYGTPETLRKVLKYRPRKRFSPS